MPGFDDLSDAQLAAMSDEELEALGRAMDEGQAVPEAAPVEPEAPAPAPEPTPDPEAAEQAPAPEPEARRGDPEVPLRHERERRRQAEEQLAQYQALLQDPAALAQLAQQMGVGLQAQEPQQAPDLFEDTDRALAFHLEQHTAPLKQQLAEMQAFIQQQQQAVKMAQLQAQYGPEAPQMIAHFDQVAPHKAHLEPEDKLLLMKASLAARPESIESKAKALAEKIVAEQLQSKAPKAVTIDGLPPAKGHEPEIDIAKISPDDFNKLSDAQIKAMSTRY